MYIIGMSVLAGIFGTGLGGLLTVILGNRTDKMISFLLSFAGGIMTSIVFFELIPDAILHSNTIVTIIGFSAGTIGIWALNFIIDRSSIVGQEKTKLHENYKEYFHANEIIASKKSMINSGILMFFVIALHNIPEGLAIGTAAKYDIRLGTTFALMIALHNIPEGMAISAPLISGGLKKQKTVLFTFLAGVPTVLGAIGGILLGSISNIVIAIVFSISGGAMLYIVFCEILPQTAIMNKDRFPMMILLFGIVIGLLLTKI